jgi:hypothetical protein
VKRLLRSAPAAVGPVLDPIKVGVLDVAHRRFGVSSAADLGSVWAVNAGYALHLAAQPGVERVVVVDENFTDAAAEAIARRRNCQRLDGNFGSVPVRDAVGAVDAVVMFDVLLHQVDPDWDEVLGLYADQTSCFVLAGPWYRGGAGETVRLLELGEERYLELVCEQEIHQGLFDRLDELNAQRGRLWRDVHDIWQWGITDADLRWRMSELGFLLGHYENHGTWRGLPAFESGAYVFARPELIEGRR